MAKLRRRLMELISLVQEVVRNWLKIAARFPAVCHCQRIMEIVHNFICSEIFLVPVCSSFCESKHYLSVVFAVVRQKRCALASRELFFWSVVCQAKLRQFFEGNTQNVQCAVPNQHTNALFWQILFPFLWENKIQVCLSLNTACLGTNVSGSWVCCSSGSCWLHAVVA